MPSPSLTTPAGEQILFRSANTGDQSLDDYLEAAEIGGRALSDLLGDIFDPGTGILKLGEWTGAWAAATLYAVGDVVLVNSDLVYYCKTAHTSGGAFSATNWTLLYDFSISVAAAAASAAAALASETAAAASYDSFDDRYLGPKAADPTLDNDGNALLTGALYWNTGSSVMKAYSGSAWVITTAVGALLAANNLSDVSNAATARTNLGLVIGTDVAPASLDNDVKALAGTVTASLSSGTTALTANRRYRITATATATLPTYTAGQWNIIEFAMTSGTGTVGRNSQTIDGVAADDTSTRYGDIVLYVCDSVGVVSSKHIGFIV